MLMHEEGRGRMPTPIRPECCMAWEAAQSECGLLANDPHSLSARLMKDLLIRQPYSGFECHLDNELSTACTQSVTPLTCAVGAESGQQLKPDPFLDTHLCRVNLEDMTQPLRGGRGRERERERVSLFTERGVKRSHHPSWQQGEGWGEGGGERQSPSPPMDCR